MNLFNNFQEIREVQTIDKLDTESDISQLIDEFIQDKFRPPRFRNTLEG